MKQRVTKVSVPSSKVPSESGDKNENKFGGCFMGFRYSTEMPRKF